MTQTNRRVFLRRFAGHVETGRPSASDLLIATA